MPYTNYRGHLKYGPVKTRLYEAVPARIAASQTFKAKGANFVVRNASGHFTSATATDAILYGIIEAADETSSSTAGATIKNMIPATQFPSIRVPVLTGTATVAMIGKTCDIVVSSSRIGANVEASTYDVLLILEVDTTNNDIIATFNPDKLTGFTGVV